MKRIAVDTRFAPEKCLNPNASESIAVLQRRAAAYLYVPSQLERSRHRLPRCEALRTDAGVDAGRGDHILSAHPGLMIR